MSYEELLVELDKWAPPVQGKKSEPPPNLRVSTGSDSCAKCQFFSYSLGRAYGGKGLCMAFKTEVNDEWECDFFRPH
jgi:hypothetical protein